MAWDWIERVRGLGSRIRVRWRYELAERERLAGHPAEAERRIHEAWGGGGASARLDPLLQATLLSSLGITLKDQGRLGEAARAYLEGLRVARRHFGPDHLVLAAFYHNLGGLEHARGRHARGVPFARRAVAIRSRALGPEHADTARDVAALAALLDGLGRHREAEALHRQSLRVLQRRLGSGHCEVGYVLANLSACLHLQNRTTEAAGTIDRALAIQERTLGANHPDTAKSRANHAVIRKMDGVVHDVGGRLVRVLADDLVAPGRSQRVWDLPRRSRGPRPSRNLLRPIRGRSRPTPAEARGGFLNLDRQTGPRAEPRVPREDVMQGLTAG